MRPLFGPRTVLEAAFLVAVPIVALEVGLGWPAIAGAGAAAYLVVLLVEAAIWRAGSRDAHPAARETAVPDAASVRVIRTEATPTPREPEPEPVAAAAPVASPAAEHVSALEPEPPAVVPISPAPVARQWNVWDLERLARENAGGDPVADEERTFLLMYLRDFAGPDGLLPVDFDDLVRQSFGGLLAAP